MPNLYNIVAELCSKLVNTCSEEFFVKYSCIAPAEKNRIYGVVQAGVGTLFQEGVVAERGSIRKLDAADLTEDFFGSLSALMLRLESEGDYYEPRIGRYRSFAALLLHLGA